MSMFDAIIVGARCAGAASGMLLARKGYRVLLIDRDTFPSDLVPSTHMIWHAGAAYLQGWGLLARLAATGCRPMRKFNLDLGPFMLSGEAPPAGDIACCYAPRRYVLDGLLVEAATEAGAELRQGSVSHLAISDNQVAGVCYTDENGARREERARIVIGADGSNSTVARSVNAASYHEQPQLAGVIYSYFSDCPIDGMEFYSRPGRMVFAWSTNDDQTLVGMSIRYEDYRRLARAADGAVEEEIRLIAPQLYARLQEAERAGPWHKGATRNFCRTPHGPGWALVGDAGLTMDPITGAGITNAFRDAERLAEAVHDVLSRDRAPAQALERFGAERDATTLPLYDFTCAMAKLETPPPEVVNLMVALEKNAQATSDYFGLFAQTVRVETFFAPENIGRIMQDAAPSS